MARRRGQALNSSSRSCPRAPSRLATLPDRLRQFLESHEKAKTVRFFRGRVNRDWALHELSHYNSALIRNPAVREVFEEFDKKLQGIAPNSHTYPDLAKQLKERLEKGVPVFKDRVNRAALARDLRVRPAAFDLDEECLAILADEEARLRFERSCAPYSQVHKRNYSFTHFIKFLGEARTVSLASEFVDFAEGFRDGTAKSLYGALSRGLSTIAEETAFIDVIDDIRVHQETSRSRATECLRWLREHLAKEGGLPSTIYHRIGTTRRVFEALGLLSNALNILQPQLGLRRRTLPKQSLVEAHAQSINDLANWVAQYAQSRAFECDKRELQLFIGNLAAKGRLGKLDRDEFVSAIEKENRRRLDRIFELAEAVFQRGKETFLDGQKGLQASVSQEPEIVDHLSRYDAGLISPTEFRRFFTHRASIGLQAYLYYVERFHGGLVPRSKRSLTNAEQIRRSRLNVALGGPDAIQAKLSLSADAICAACLMYLIESGANGSVARTLTVDSIQSSTIAGHRQVVGWKARGGGKPIYNDLPNKSISSSTSAVEALEFVRSAQPKLARHNNEHSECLFLLVSIGTVKPLPEHTLRDFLRRLVRDDEDLADLNLRVDMIRSSVLLDAALASDGNIRVATAVANHANASMTSHYTEKLPMRLIYEKKVREFQDSLEIVVVSGVEGAIGALNLSKSEIETRSNYAVRTGLGRLCLNPFAGLQPSTNKGAACDQLQACNGCSAMLLVADPELIADLIIWHGSLRDTAEEFAAVRPQRFESKWLPELAWCEAALAAFQRGPHSRIFAQAETLARTRLSDPEFEAPKPW